MIYTTIYWLVDKRPETIAAGWPDGLSFYCGMTIASPKQIIRNLLKQRSACGRAEMIRECGPHIEVRTMEIVEPLSNKREKLKRWQERMRQQISQVSPLKRRPEKMSKHQKWRERQCKVADRTLPKKMISPPPY